MTLQRYPDLQPERDGREAFRNSGQRPASGGLRPDGPRHGDVTPVANAGSLIYHGHRRPGLREEEDVPGDHYRHRPVRRERQRDRHVIITDVNEEPDWVMGKAPRRPDHEENDTASWPRTRLRTPRGPGSPILSQRNRGIGSDATTDDDALLKTDFADSALLKINLLDGTLSFKSPPNYEKPRDGLTPMGNDPTTTDNMYKVVVKATVVDSPDLVWPPRDLPKSHGHSAQCK